MRVALAQLDARLGDIDANAERAREVIVEATAAGADLVVFPELYLSGYALRGVERETARTAEEVALLVGGSALVGFHEARRGQTPDWSAKDEVKAETPRPYADEGAKGTGPRSGPRGYNSAAYVADGELVHVHRKLYLVDYEPFGEDELFEPGSELRAFDSPLGRLGTLICNDAWQPFLPFIATQDGARVLLVPSCSSTAVREAEAYWHELTRFYARMLQCFVVFVNRIGTEGALTFWGGSHVTGPDGLPLVHGPRSREAILYADLDLERVEKRRRELSIVGDPRLDLVLSELGRLARKRGQRPT
ncbi:MAG: amidohydrolase [Actinobacteria bacterium]|nr:MAG: amidohydrolase [Actinomycetota bacterium]